MNQYGVLTTPEEWAAHDDGTYETFDEEGTYRVRLDFRGWYQNGRHYGIICHFTDLEEGVGWKAFCFRKNVNGNEVYCPQDKSVDFERVEDGTIWDVTIAKTPKGKYTFASAKKVEVA